MFVFSSLTCPADSRTFSVTRGRLVWLSARGHDFLTRDQGVLSVVLLRAAVEKMAPADRKALGRAVRRAFRGMVAWPARKARGQKGRPRGVNPRQYVHHASVAGPPERGN
jgi:hypothetical protein